MKEYKPIIFQLLPKFGKVSEEQEQDYFFFDWAIFTEPDNSNREFTTKEKLLLFQMFVTQMATHLVLGDPGMREQFQAAQPTHKMTKKQRQIMQDSLLKLYLNTIQRFFDEKQLMVEKPTKPTLL